MAGKCHEVPFKKILDDDDDVSSVMKIVCKFVYGYIFT